MFHTSLLRCVRQVFALLDFALCAHRPEILDTVYTVNSSRGTLQRVEVFQISSHHLNSFARQSLGGSAISVAGQGSQLPSLGQHVADDRSTLPTGGSGDEHCFVGIYHAHFPRFMFCVCPTQME